jgi:hypothetical protein
MTEGPKAFFLAVRRFKGESKARGPTSEAVRLPVAWQDIRCGFRRASPVVFAGLCKQIRLKKCDPEIAPRG